MPAGPIGLSWLPGSWSDTSWEAGSWGDSGPVVTLPVIDTIDLEARDEFVTDIIGTV